MAGIGQSDVEPISAGVSAQPIVSPVNPVVTPDAVTALVDAFRKGAIGAADIQDRIGAEAMAQKKAHIQQLSEYVSPEAINGRLAQIQAQQAQAQLTAAQATAQTGLVPAQTQLSARQLAAQNAAAVYGQGGLDTFQKSALWYHDNAANYKNPDGTYDFEAMAQKGNERANELGLAQNWLQQLTPSGKQRTVEGADGQTYVQDLNQWGVNVTPPDPESGYKGSDAYWAYVKQLQNFLPPAHPARGQYMMSPIGGKPEAAGRLLGAARGPHDIQPTVIPDNPAYGPIAIPGESPASEPPVQPKPPEAVAAPAIGTTELTSNAPGIRLKPAQTPAEAKSSLFANPLVKKYYESRETYDGFADASKQSVSAPSSVSDLALAEAYTKLFDPTARITEFKWDELKKSVPLFSMIKNYEGYILKNNRFPDDVRKQIINSGASVIDRREKSLAAPFDAAEAAKPGVLDSEQQMIRKGVPFSVRQEIPTTAPGAAGTSAAGSSKTVSVPGFPNGVKISYP